MISYANNKNIIIKIANNKNIIIKICKKKQKVFSFCFFICFYNAVIASASVAISSRDGQESLSFILARQEWDYYGVTTPNYNSFLVKTKNFVFLWEKDELSPKWTFCIYVKSDKRRKKRTRWQPSLFFAVRFFKVILKISL